MHTFLTIYGFFVTYIRIYFNVGGVGSSLVLKIGFIYPMVVR